MSPAAGQAASVVRGAKGRKYMRPRVSSPQPAVGAEKRALSVEEK